MRFLPVGTDPLRPESGVELHFNAQPFAEEFGQVEELSLPGYHGGTAARHERAPARRGELSADGEFCPLAKGKNAVVFEEHHAFLRDLARDCKPFLFAPFHLSRLAHFLAAIDKFQYARGAGVQLLIGDEPRLIIGDERLVIFLIEGKLDVQPRFCGGGAVAHRFPVRIDGAVEAELFAQNVKPLLVFGCVDAVDTVVRAHCRNGLCPAGKLERL